VLRADRLVHVAPASASRTPACQPQTLRLSTRSAICRLEDWQGPGFGIYKIPSWNWSGTFLNEMHHSEVGFLDPCAVAT